MFSASLYVSARGGRAKNDFGLDIADTHPSGCLIVKDATGKAAECGIRKLDLICLARGMDLTVRSMHALTDSTPCDIFTVRLHSVPCLSIPVNSRIDVGLKLKMNKLQLRQHDPSKLSNHFIVESVTAGSVASNHAIAPGDWILSINGLLLSRKSLDEVQLLLKGDGRSALELCTWSNPIRLSNSPDSEKHEINWSTDPRLGGFLAGSVICSVIGGVVIILFFRKQEDTPPPPPPPPIHLSPEDTRVIQDLNDPDLSKQKIAETELKNIFDDESGKRSDSQKTDVRSALIRAGMHKIWANEIRSSFLENPKNSALEVRWRDRLIHFCNLIRQQKNREVRGDVQGTTRQERENSRATTDTTFDILLEIAKNEFWNSIDPNSSEFFDLLDTRLLVLFTLAHQAHTDYKLQRKAERGGIFDILFEILANKIYEKPGWRSSFFGFASVSTVVLYCFQNFVRTNFRLQQWFKEECRKKAIDLPKGSFFSSLFSLSPNFQHIDELTKFYDELCGRQPTSAIDDAFATVSMERNIQIDGTCYAYASARSFIHW